MSARDVSEKAARICYPNASLAAIERIAAVIRGSPRAVDGLEFLIKEYPNRPEYIIACVDTISGVSDAANYTQ